MASQEQPPASPDETEERARLIEALRPLAERVAADDLNLISIGDRCLTSSVLGALGLKPRAFPFDWLFSSLGMVRHCLSDDFAEFLNPEQHERVPMAERGKPGIHRAHHRLYRDAFGVQHVFMHHEMPESLPHFERAVERFRNAHNPILLHITARRSQKVAGEVAEVADAANARVLAVCVSHSPTNAAPEIRSFAAGDDYEIFDMATEAPANSLSFGKASDEEAFARLLLDRLN